MLQNQKRLHGESLPEAYNSKLFSEDSQVCAPALTPGSEEIGVADLVEAWVRRSPEQPAVREAGGKLALTYRELWERSGWLSTQLARVGVRKGDLVAIDLPRSVDLVVAFLGIIRAGAAYLPLDPLAPPDRVAGIIEESGVRVAICAPSGSRIQASHVQLLDIPHQPPEGPILTQAGSGADAVYVTYTSGSTGRPKGVVIAHRGVVGLVFTPDYFVIDPGERVANIGNPAFDITTVEIWHTLTSGATVVPFPQFTDRSMGEWLTLVREENISTMFLTTSLFHTIAWERPDAFKDLHNLLVGGEQLDLAAVRQVLAAGSPERLINAYGPTEVTVLATFFLCTEQSLADVDRVPIGYASQQAELFVLDDDLQVTPPGEVGELCLGGPRLATGYLNRPELTSERFVIEPRSGKRIYRTGDLVRQLSSGALEMVGRRDRQIKLRGFRIELEEIERVAVATDLVSAAFVEKVGEGASAALVGFVLPARGQAGRAVDEELSRQLSARLSAHLPDYMVPSRWVVLSELPLGARGKADRAAMRAMLDQLEGAEAQSVPDEWPADPLSTEIRAILQDLLGTSRLAAGASFVELGGNSILAMRTAYRIRQRLGFPLEPADVLHAPSMKELLNHLGSVGTPGA
ncbi:MAG TPA: non-ribosomal peptide synthetase [Ktedonobacteraceae bacterium]|nr:non-ribosomal peptide synthetase [Ktedonobacteraceae bacterium]